MNIKIVTIDRLPSCLIYRVMLAMICIKANVSKNLIARRMYEALIFKNGRKKIRLACITTSM